jgi:hypothetical protein
LVNSSLQRSLDRQEAVQCLKALRSGAIKPVRIVIDVTPLALPLTGSAAKAGWKRWYVPQAKVVHAHQAVTDRRLLTRRTWWHWRGTARFVRKHPERLKVL